MITSLLIMGVAILLLVVLYSLLICGGNSTEGAGKDLGEGLHGRQTDPGESSDGGKGPPAQPPAEEPSPKHIYDFFA